MAEPRYGEERKQMGSIVGDRPKISVIMGVYNGADRVDEAIASIRVQTFTDWEFIICDDASTDNTWEKLIEWSKIDSRIVPIRNEKNMKLAATLNKCLEHASGSYIARMDDDDYSYPWRLMAQNDFLDVNTYYAFVSGQVRYTVDFEKTTYSHCIDEVKVRYQGFKALGLLPWGFIYVIRPLIVGLIPHETLLEIKLEDNGVDLRKYRRRHRNRRK